MGWDEITGTLYAVAFLYLGGVLLLVLGYIRTLMMVSLEQPALRPARRPR